MSLITVVMPCYNRAHDLQRVLNAYDQQTDQHSFEIIAIDDASTDGTYELLTSYQPQHYKLRVERLPYNQGPASARNKGISLVETPLLAIVGDDILPDSNFILNHVVAHCYHPEPYTAILGHVAWPKDMPCNTLMTHIDGKGAQQFSYYHFKHGQVYDFRHFYTANISLKTNFLKQLDSWFDTDFVYAAFEDAELGYRLAQKGLQIIYDKNPVGYHYHYHTIYTFAQRQYKAGLMGKVLARKHPQLAKAVRLERIKPLIALAILHRLGGTSIKVAEVAGWLEKQALQLASSYEWHQHQQLDYLYRYLLEYFWRKGLIEGTFHKFPYMHEIRDAYIVYYLGNFLMRFLSEYPSGAVLSKIALSSKLKDPKFIRPIEIIINNLRKVV